MATILIHTFIISHLYYLGSSWNALIASVLVCSQHGRRIEPSKKWSRAHLSSVQNSPAGSHPTQAKAKPLPQPRRIYRTCLPRDTLTSLPAPPPRLHLATLVFTCQAYSYPRAFAPVPSSSWEVLSQGSSLSCFLQVCARKVPQRCPFLPPSPTIPGLHFRSMISVYLGNPTRPYEIQYDQGLL